MKQTLEEFRFAITIKYISGNGLGIAVGGVI